MHVIVWEYTVPEAHRDAFERDYGPNGDWVALFRSAPGYIGTELLRDEKIPGRYITIDRWATEADFAAFKKTSGALYEAMDRQFESLTSHEVKTGTFRSVQ